MDAALRRTADVTMVPTPGPCRPGCCRSARQRGPRPHGGIGRHGCARLCHAAGSSLAPRARLRGSGAAAARGGGGGAVGPDGVAGSWGRPACTLRVQSEPSSTRAVHYLQRGLVSGPWRPASSSRVHTWRPTATPQHRGDVGGPPGDVGGPPRDVGGPPWRVGGPPWRVGGPPRDVGGPPGDVGGPPWRRRWPALARRWLALARRWLVGTGTSGGVPDGAVGSYGGRHAERPSDP